MAVPFSSLIPGLLPRRQKHYLMSGFPESKGKPNPIAREVAPTAYTYWGISIDDSKYSEHGREAETHVILHFDRENIEGPDGIVRAFPYPGGMSGSPMWMFFDENGRNDADRMPLVAVATRYHQKPGLFVATDIGIAISLMHEAV